MSSSPHWTKERPNILSAEVSAKLKRAFQRGIVFGYHSFYYGGRSLDKWAFKTFEDFTDYVRSRAKPGDLFTVWSVPELLERNLHLFSGRFSEADQETGLIVPPAPLSEIKAYLEAVKPEYAPHRMNEVIALYLSPREDAPKIGNINLFYEDDWDDFVSELRGYSRPGAEIHLFPVEIIETKENIFLDEKYPNENGQVPVGGAY